MKISIERLSSHSETDQNTQCDSVNSCNMAPSMEFTIADKLHSSFGRWARRQATSTFSSTTGGEIRKPNDHLPENGVVAILRPGAALKQTRHFATTRSDAGCGASISPAA